MFKISKCHYKTKRTIAWSVLKGEECDKKKKKKQHVKDLKNWLGENYTHHPALARRLTTNGMLTVLMRSTSGLPADFSGTKTKDLGLTAKTLVPFSKKVTFSLGLYSLVWIGHQPVSPDVFCFVFKTLTKRSQMNREQDGFP